MSQFSDIERAVNLRMAGATYSEIGKRLGVDALEAEDMVSRYLEATSTESADVQVRLELARLDSLLKSIWKQASLGDATAVGQALKITGQRAVLLARLGDAVVSPEPELSGCTVGDELAAIRERNRGA